MHTNCFIGTSVHRTERLYTDITSSRNDGWFPLLRFAKRRRPKRRAECAS